MIQTRQCCHTRDQSHWIAGNRVLLPTLFPEKADMFSNAFESTLQKVVQTMDSCRLILLIRSSSARSGESSISASPTVPFDLRDTLATFRRLHIKTVLSITDLSLESSSGQSLTLVQNDSADR